MKILSLLFIPILTLFAATLLPAFCGSGLVAQSHYPGQHADKLIVADQATMKVQSFDLRDVKLLDSPFLMNQQREAKWLLSIDNNRLLHTYRLNAGIPSKAKPLGGWEEPTVELRGHSAGHVLSGLALMFASTGEETFKLKGDSLVAELKKVQDALDQNGYLSAFPQHFINRAIHEGRVWAPWYTLHKIYAGLLDMYLYCDNQMAFEMVKKMGNWAYTKLSGLDQTQLDKMLLTEFGGMSEVMYNLYSLTGESKYLKTAKMFYHRMQLDPLAIQNDVLQKRHANTYIPKIIGEARAYEFTGDDKQKQIAEFFWSSVIQHHTYANGGNSDNELFFAPDSLSKHLSHRTTETCNTYNMLKLTDHLFSWSADVKYADYYEHALYNHILGSQDPETGMVCYFMPLKPGYFKVYSTKEDSWWCCVGTGFENHAKYGEAIYFHNDRELFVNLFIPSEVTWRAKGIQIRQETRYPEKENSRLTILATPGEKFALKLRYPGWATLGMKIKINGTNQHFSEKAGSYITLDRKWKKGDVVELSIPMPVRLFPTNDKPNLAAITYGPLLLAGLMGKEGMHSPAPYAEDQDDLAKFPVPSGIKTTVNTGGKRITDMVKRVEGKTPLTFEIRDARQEKVTLLPYWQIHDERYVVYWEMVGN